MSKLQIGNQESNKGIVTHEFMAIIVEYITKVSSRYRGNEFTSSQLAKTILAITEIGHTRFPAVHRIVKDILRAWYEEGLCDHIATTKYSRCRKTKDTYRFTSEGLKEIKKIAIDGTIETIQKHAINPSPIMKTREFIIKDQLEQLMNSVTNAD